LPVPKRKCSRVRRDHRRAHVKLSKPNLTECQSCGEPIMPHRVCPKCGHYKDRLSVNTEND